jgi:hypothetical protein
MMLGCLSRQETSPWRSDKSFARVRNDVSLEINDAFIDGYVPIPTLLALPSMPITNLAPSIIKEI